MAIFSLPIKVKALNRNRTITLKLIVDTGAFLTVIPKDKLQRLGIKPLWRRRFSLANGEKIERDVGVAIFRWNEQEGSSEVIFGEPGDKSLLGALTLESLGLKVNPRKGTVEPIDFLLL